MNKKCGFTLSELLMSIAIIAIVSAMGMTIAKRGTDDAYKNYFAVGTMNLSNALAQIETGNTNVRPNPNGPRLEIRTRRADGQFVPGNPDRDIFERDLFTEGEEGRVVDDDYRGPQWITNCLKYLFDDTNIKQNNNLNPNSNDVADHCVINASNGITYEITDIVNNPNNNPELNYIRIMMTVPAPRRRINNGHYVDKARTEFLYDRNVNGQNIVNIANLGNSRMLIPLHQDNNNVRADLRDIPYVSLQDREDLLMAYIDNGTVGRHIPNQNQDFTPIRYGTFRDALCTILGGNDARYNVNNVHPGNQNTDVILNCAANHNLNNSLPRQLQAIDLSRINNNNSINSGVIKFASPRKLK